MNYHQTLKKSEKKNYDSAWIKKGRSGSSKRANRISKTRSKRFLDKIVKSDFE